MATPATGTSPPSNIRPQAARTPGRLGSEEFHSAPLPGPQEAAVLYSANQPAAAASLLKAEIKDAAGRNNKQAWLMLFDLHQAAHDRAEFDSLSMLFKVKFEQSPPAWAEGGEAAADPRRAAPSRERKDYFALKPNAEGEIAPEIAKFLAFAQAHGSVRLDVAKTTSFSGEEAQLFAAALAKLRKERMPMWFNHLDSLEKVLRAAFNEKAQDEQKPYWTLLFELLILQGKSQEFEDVGLEYAVAFEVSPPNFEAYVNPAAAAKPPDERSAPQGSASGADESAFALKGVLSAASANQIAELNSYAASRSEVPVDMSKVLRVDFAYTGAFCETVKALQLAGKRVILAGLNELNAALLEALGINRYAILVRRKSS
jgi:anti-anti-sigma regulatory factor